MTKLLEWILALVAGTIIWLLMLTGNITFIPNLFKSQILFLPIYVIVAFGLYSLSVIVYRVYTFNDCTDAAVSLRKEIEEATQDLRKKGFRFSD